MLSSPPTNPPFPTSHNFGSNGNFDNMLDMCQTAFDNGITHFDLANNYGPVYGAAEENFGRILKKSLGAYRDELAISTKAGYDMWPGPYGDWGSKKYLVASLDQREQLCDGNGLLLIVIGNPHVQGLAAPDDAVQRPGGLLQRRVEIFKDYAGNDRVVQGVWSACSSGRA